MEARIVVYEISGTDAFRQYHAWRDRGCEGPLTLDEYDYGYHFVRHEFATWAEVHAFCAGYEAGNGWMEGQTIVDPGEVADLDRTLGPYSGGKLLHLRVV
jgi:hypothetical protein